MSDYHGPKTFDVGKATEQAYARRSDPATSHQAAASLSSDGLRRSQRLVLEVLRRYGPMTDDALQHAYLRSAEAGWPHQSPSGLRSRRAELASKQLVHDTGERSVLASGRKAILWGYGPDPARQDEHDGLAEQEPLFS